MTEQQNQTVQQTKELLQAAIAAHRVIREEVLPSIIATKKIKPFQLAMQLMPLQDQIKLAMEGFDQIAVELADLDATEFQRELGPLVLQLVSEVIFTYKRA